MKTSNYIIIAFFTFIFGGMLFLFIAARGHENDWRLGVRNMTLSSTELADLADFSVIVAEPDAIFTIEQSDSCRLTVYYPEKEIEPKNTYRISGDTLYLLRQEEFVSTNVYLNVTQLSSLVLKENSRISTKYLRMDTLSVLAESADIHIMDGNIKNLILQANNSTIHLSSDNINHISAKLENNTSLTSRNIGKVIIEKDSTSQYSFH